MACIAVGEIARTWCCNRLLYCSRSQGDPSRHIYDIERLSGYGTPQIKTARLRLMVEVRVYEALADREL